MDQEKAQTEQLNGASDAGHKMASANPDASASATHELKIMDVEGAVETAPTVEPPVVILVDDDEPVEEVEEEQEDADLVDIGDEDNAPLVAELQSALNNPDDKPVGEDPLLGDPERDVDTMSAKTEPSSDAESNHSYHDPMGLLERIETQADSQDEDEDYSVDDGSSVNGGTTRKKMPRAKRWLIWMKRWPWMLHEDSDGTYAFCLYCNMSINVNNRAKHIQQHNMSLYHQERECNYVAFKKTEEQTRGATSDNEVKHEFGTKSYVAAMKKKRISEIEAFNNFNWLRWLRWHPWLERAQAQGTVGLCRICNIQMNVEFVYLRKRHETTKGHLEALRQQESDKPSRKRKRSKSTSGPSLADEEAEPEPEQEREREEDPEAEDTTVVTINGQLNNSEDPGKWFELIPDTNPQQCRCTLCNCPMAITSYMRHCKANAHCHKLTTAVRSTTERGIWAMYADVHPWIIADPKDPNLAYCKVCQKRFMYGNSEIKRRNHENSEKHLAAIAAAKAATEGRPDGEHADDGSGEEEEGAQVPASEPTQSDGRSESEEEEEDDDNWSDKQKGNKGLAAKSISEPRKAKARAGVRFYPWLCYTKDRKTQLCKYCRVRFHNESAKARHEFSARHQKLMKQFKARQAKLPQANNKPTNKMSEDEEAAEEEEEEEEEDEDGQSNTDSGTVENKKIDTRPIDKLFVKPIPATMKGKVMVWKSRFPWLSYKKSELRGNYAWCKLCDVSIFLPSSKWAAKHQRTSRHIRLRNERRRNGGQPPKPAPKPTEGISAAVATAAALASGEARQKAAMAELQSKYSWLDPDANDENHCHCRLCDTRLPIKVFYLRQHDSSRKHAESLERLRSNKAKEAAPSVSTNSEATAEAEVQESGLEVDKDSDADMSVRSDGSTAEPPAKRSRRSMEVRRIIRALRESIGKRHEERSQLDMAKDMICSSFDIVSRLRTMEREAVAMNGNSTAQAPESPRAAPVNAQPLEPRHVLDLFFDSISPTMKALPPDLAAEGKAKIMQLVCGLEVRAMHRNSAKATSPASSPAAETPVGAASAAAAPAAAAPAPAAEVPAASAPAAPADTDFHSTVITIDDDQIMQNNNNDVESTPNKSSGGGPTASLTINGNPKDLPENIRRILSSSQLQVTNRNDPDSVRCVPLDKLTTQSRVNGNGSGNGRHNLSGSLDAPPTPVSVPMPEMPNGNTLAMLRQIRVNNNNSSKMITISKAPMVQPQPQPQHSGGMSSSPMMRGAPNSAGGQMNSYRTMLNHNRRP